MTGTRVPRRGRLIGLDLGARRIGVAVTDTGRTLATSVATVVRSGDRRSDHARLASLVSEYGAEGVVVGLPLSLSGGEGPAARRVLEEVPEIEQALGVPVETFDERFTTVAAAAGMRSAGLSARRQRAGVDAAAAAELLQTWIDRHRAVKEQGR